MKNYSGQSLARGLLVSVTLLLAIVPAAVKAQVAATPAPSPSPASPAAPQIPKNFDPCGGPLELLNKIGNGTACVFILGEAALTAQYSSANIPANAQLTGLGHTLNVSGYAHAFGYPAPVVYVGVAPRAEIVVTTPSFVQINSGRFGTLAAGTSDMSFQYKQLVYLNSSKFTMVALDLEYKAPTGSQALRGPGPEYTIDPIITQPLPHNFGLTVAFPIDNFTVNCFRCSGAQRGWGFSPQLVPYWESPGGTLLALFVQHTFNPNTTPVAFSAGQLIGRHLELALTEGGFVRTASATGPFDGLINASATAYPSLFNVSANYLIGRSDLPAQP